MTRVNRVLLALAALVLGGVGGTLVVAPGRVIASVASGQALLRAAGPPTVLQVGLVLVAAGLVLLILELWPRSQSRILEIEVEGARVRYPADLVIQRAEADLRRREAIEEARIRLRGRAAQLTVHGWLRLGEGVAPQAAAQRAAKALREQLEREFGLGVRDVRLTVQQPSRERLLASAASERVAGAVPSTVPPSSAPTC